jgi:hypothetical protein
MSDTLEHFRIVARDCIPDPAGFKTEDPRTGRQHMRFWLPDPLKELMIEEYKRPEEKKTRIAAIKYFNPYGSGTWWFSEYDPDNDLFWGLCYIQFDEYGYCSMKELRETPCPPFNLPIERDYWFTPEYLSLIKASL